MSRMFKLGRLVACWLKPDLVQSLLTVRTRRDVRRKLLSASLSSPHVPLSFPPALVLLVPAPAVFLS